MNADKIQQICNLNKLFPLIFQTDCSVLNVATGEANRNMNTIDYIYLNVSKTLIHHFIDKVTLL